jgi:F-type H+-transporting ATPase subunit b
VLIDWFTVVAQIVNFVVLVALLKHFLFGRIVRAIDDREKGIAARLADADEKNAASAREIERCRAMAAEHRQQCEIILQHAKCEAEEERKDLVAQARENVRALEQKWRSDLEVEKRVLREDLRKRTAAGVLAVAQRALSDLASSDLQTASVQAFIEKVQQLETAALQKLSGELTVLSRDLPSPEQQSAIRAAIEDRVGPVNLQFEPNDALPWGIELRGNGRRIGWTPDTYLDLLEHNLTDTLEKERAFQQYAA